MIVLDHICLQYKGSTRNILNDIELILPDKGLVMIVGPSGSGKSSLLHVIAQFIKPSKGRMYFYTQDVTDLKGKELDEYHRNIGFVFQNYNLIPYLNVEENICLSRNICFLNEILEALGLAKYKKKKVNRLSGGECQRVAVARTITSDSKILLCDEPTGALDVKTGNELMKLLHSIAQDKLVIVVTHNKEHAKKFGDRIITLEDGCIIKDTDPNPMCSFDHPFSEQRKTCSLFKIVNIVKNNLVYKWKRNVLAIVAFSIGLLTLLFVLGISSGFKEAILLEEKNSLSEYPLYISKDSQDLNTEIKQIFKTKKVHENSIEVKEGFHENKLTNAFIKELASLETYTHTIDFTFFYDEVCLKQIGTSSFFDEQVEVLKGSKETKEDELLLLVNQDNTIPLEYIHILGLKKGNYSYDDFLNRKVNIGKKTYKIIGLVKGKEDSYYQDVVGLMTKQKTKINKKPIEVYIYPKDYESKQFILKHLKNYPDIFFTDYSETIKNVTTTIIDGIRIVLLIFSFVSLFVTMFMIAIITYIAVIERMHEIGLLRSLGYSKSAIKLIFYLENGIVSSIAFLVSFIILSGLKYPLNHLLFQLIGMDSIFKLDQHTLLLVFSFSILISMMGSFIPIRKIKKMSIIDTLKYE